MAGDSISIASVIIAAYLGMAGDHASLYQGRAETAFSQTAWVTHPYLDQEAFRTGTICFDGTLYASVPLRYNILLNQLAVITPEGKRVVAPDQDRVDWFDVDGQHYVRQDGWFMREEYSGERVALLLHRTKQYAGDVEIDRHMYHDMEAVDTYYLRLPDGTLREISGSRSMGRAVPGHRKELRRFVRDNKLEFWHHKKQESLRLCAERLDQLLASDHPESEEDGGLRIMTTGATALSDSIVASIPVVGEVPAYRAYGIGSELSGDGWSVDGDAADEEGASTPGIAPLSTLTEPRTLSEVEVLGMSGKMEQRYEGIESFRPALLRNIPLVMGEADVLKIATKLPGVTTTGEASSGINVRGGASEQTQILYNGNTVFNPMHMFGLFSAFNPDLVAETELMKGSIPSQYGGRLSSVMNIRGKMPDRKEFHGSVSVGPVTSKAMAEIPLVRNRVSLMLGGRATYSDWMLKLLPKEDKEDDMPPLDGGSSSYYGNTGDYRDGKAGYWDAGGTLSASLSPTQTLLVNGYYSRDRFALTRYRKYAYGNMNASAELRSHYGEHLSTVITAGYDHYGYNNDDSELPTSAARLSFDLSQWFVKGVADYTLSDTHQLNMGAQANVYNIMPGRYEPLGSLSMIVGRELTRDKAVEGALWVEDTWTQSPEMKVNGGVRLNLFRSMKEGLETFSIRPDIRISASYSPNGQTGVKAGFNTMHQYIHKVSNTVIMSPTDIWMLSNSGVKPQSGWQLSAGYYRQSDNGEYEFTAETYFKGMRDYLTYRSAAILVMNDELHKDVVGTQGRAWGLELQLRKLYGRLNGWINYTYSRTQLRQRKGGAQQPINGGRWFAADYDCPHNVKLVCNYKMTRRYSTSLNADYSTGRPYTAPVGIMPSETTGHYTVPLYSDRNALRMPDYFRVDWSFNVEPRHRLTALTHRWLTIGVYNLLGRRNAYSIFFEGSYSTITAYKLSVFGAPIPYINYNIRF